MKVVIDIDDETYETIKNAEPLKWDCPIESAYKAIKNGTPIPDNAINGDVIKAMFSNSHIDDLSHTVWVGYDQMSFKRDWWNAPYKAESEDKE